MACPSKYLLEECTITFAPYLNGSHKYGVAIVLSIISGTSISFASLDIFLISSTGSCYLLFPQNSPCIGLAYFKSSSISNDWSIKLTSMPNF